MTADTPQVVDAQPAETEVEVMEQSSALARNGPDPTGFLGIIREAARSKTDPATMRELLNVYKDAQAQRAAEAYAEAIVQFRRVVRAIIMTGHRDDTKTKNSRDEYGTVKYGYAELTTTIEQIQPFLDQCQLTPTWRMTKSDPGFVELECIVTHILKHKESSGPFGSPVGEGRKGQTPVQVRQGVVTSLKRATLFMVLGLTTKEDDLSLAAAEQGSDAPEAPRSKSAIEDPEKDAKRDFWNAAQKKTGSRLSRDQVVVLFGRVQQLSGQVSAADCLAWINRQDVTVGTDGTVAVAIDEAAAAEALDQATAELQQPATPTPTKGVCGNESCKLSGKPRLWRDGLCEICSCELEPA